MPLDLVLEGGVQHLRFSNTSTRQRGGRATLRTVVKVVSSTDLRGGVVLSFEKSFLVNSSEASHGTFPSTGVIEPFAVSVGEVAQLYFGQRRGNRVL